MATYASVTIMFSQSPQLLPSQSLFLLQMPLQLQVLEIKEAMEATEVLEL
jgi:hypothetical protein